jgi:hypothetical protein
MVLRPGLTPIQCHKNPERPAEINDLGRASVKGLNDQRRRSPPPTVHALKNPDWPGTYR